jgi:hypothetical protein
VKLETDSVASRRVFALCAAAITVAMLAALAVAARAQATETIYWDNYPAVEC